MKVIDLKKSDTGELRDEIRMLSYLNHPNVIKSMGDYKNLIMMEYVKGDTMTKYVDNGFGSADEIADIFSQILLGLNHIHAKNLIHRDIKPDNIMIDVNGKVKILDFGWGFKIEAHKLEKDNHQIGTVHYMAPELIARDDYDQKVDIWSAGVLLYEMCVGKDPFSAKDSNKIIERIKKCDVKYRKIKEEYKKFEEPIALMLQIDPHKRPSAEDLLNHQTFKKYFKKNEFRVGQ